MARNPAYDGKPGPRILDLIHLDLVAKDRGSVCFSLGRRRQKLPGGQVGEYYTEYSVTPAAWAINWSGGRILQLIKIGLYVYEPKRKRKLKERDNAEIDTE